MGIQGLRIRGASHASRWLPAALAVLAALALGLFLAASLVSAAATASDDASDAEYADGWDNADNGGTGFGGAWSLTTNGTASHFHATSTNNGDGDGNLDGDIDTSAVAWGLTANSGGQAFADRPFLGSLPLGTQFALRMDNGLVITGGQVGFSLRNAANDSLLRFYLTGGDSTYTVQGADVQDTGVAATDEGLAITVTLVTTGAYQVDLATLDGAATATLTGSLDAGSGDQAITRLHLFNDDAGSGAPNDLFFNSLEVTPASCYALVDGGALYASANAAAVQAALDAAPDGGTIKLAGTCAGVSTAGATDQVGRIQKSVTLLGGYDPAGDWTTADPGSFPTTLDALGLGRVFAIEEVAGVVLHDLIMQGGQSLDDGGAIENHAASLLIQDSTLSNNATKSNGGAIYSALGDLTLDNTLVVDNSAGDSGGGIYAEELSIGVNAPAGTCVPIAASTAALEHLVSILNGSQVLSNTAEYGGGGLYAYNTQVVIDASTFQHNTATAGGGIYNEGDGLCDEDPVASGASLTAEPFLDAQLTISGGSLIDDNHAAEYGTTTTADVPSGAGGGLLNVGTDAAVLDSTVSNNTASDALGGLGNIAGGLIVSNTQVLSNTADYFGGGVGSAGLFVALDRNIPCTASANGSIPLGLLIIFGGEVRGNVAGYGGGVANEFGLVYIDGATITQNWAGNGGGLFDFGFPCGQPGAQDAGELELGTLNLLNSVVADNYATWDLGLPEPETTLIEDDALGGGLFTTLSTALVYSTTFSHNVAEDDGGGIASFDSLMLIGETEIVSNTAEYGSGGGLLLDYLGIVNTNCAAAPAGDISYADVLILDSTLAFNWADDAGGGIASWGPYMELDYTTVAANHAELGGGLFHEETGCFTAAPTEADGYQAAITVVNHSHIVGNAAESSSSRDKVEADSFTPFFNGGGIYSAFSSVRVADSTIESNTAADDGGGVAGFESYLHLDNTQVISNTASDGSGGGVFAGYPAYITNCLAAPTGYYWADVVVRGGSDLSHNSADNAGGGLASFGPTVLIADSLVGDNRAQLGGGVYYEYESLCRAAGTDAVKGGYSDVRIHNSSLAANRANHHDEQPDTNSFASEFYGGGFYAVDAYVDVSESAVYSNTAVDGGGGVYVLYTDLLVEDSAIHGNTAAQGGGLMSVNSTTAVNNSTVSTNTAADGDGGGILAGELLELNATDTSDSDVALNNATVADNVAYYVGQNLAAHAEEFMLRNTLIAGSPADNCYSASGAFNTAGYNLEDGDTCGLVDGTDLPETTPLLGALADNGGPTLTHALLATSPALDMGACDFDHDQRGEPRPEDGGAACDIGAYERGEGYLIWFPAYLYTLPDLVGSFTLTPNKSNFTANEKVTVTVVITNQGTAATHTGFWVDLSLNPHSAPPGVNQPWYDNCGQSPCRGIAWYVNIALAPGQSITLTSTPGSYAASHTSWTGSLPAGTTDLYLYVDSWNPTSPTAAVAESNENNNLAELHGLTVGGALVHAQPAGAASYRDRWIRPAE